MSLLELRNVEHRRGRGAEERLALRDVSLEIDAGELVTVWGRRRSGRTTLLRIASGLERPDKGVVIFDGRDLTESHADVSQLGLRFCRKTFRPAEGQTVLEQLMTGQLMRGVPPAEARSRARAVLCRVDADISPSQRPADLDSSEAIRVAIARAIVRPPKLLVVDEPAMGVEILMRDEILSLLRSLADEGIAVLSSSADAAGLAGSDRALSLASGKLNGERQTPGLAAVVPIRRAAGDSVGA